MDVPAATLAYSALPARGHLRVFHLTAIFAGAVLLAGLLAAALYGIAAPFHDASPAILAGAAALLAVLSVGGFLPTLLILRRHAAPAPRFRWTFLLGTLYGFIPALCFLLSDLTGIHNFPAAAVIVPTLLFTGPVICAVITLFIPPLLRALL